MHMNKINAEKCFVKIQTKPHTKKPKIKIKSGTIFKQFYQNDSHSNHSKTEY